jgi:hypothetical protein
LNWATTIKRPYGKDICKPATNAEENAKPNAVYTLSKINVNSPRTNINDIYVVPYLATGFHRNLADRRSTEFAQGNTVDQAL